MEVIETKAKDWGNSLGIVIPKEIVKREHIEGGKMIKILIIKDNKELLRKSFGSLKGIFKKSSQQIKDEIREEFND